MSQTTKGVLLSYGSAAVNLVSSLILLPLLIRTLSEDTYSLYKVMQSFAGSLMMFNLGLSTIAARAVARYVQRPTEDARREKENTLALTILLSLAMAGIVLLLGWAMTALVPYLFGDSYNAGQLSAAKKLVGIFSAATAVHILSDTFRGFILGREHYLVSQGSSILFQTLRFCAMTSVALRGGNVCALALVDLALYGLLLGIHFLYSRLALKETARLTSIKKTDLAPIAAFASAIVIQALVTQASTNLDTVILGVTGASPRIITMYASALTIYTVYRSLVGVLSGIYLPQAARLTTANASGKALTDFLIPPSRIQAVITLGILTGFGLLGRDFVRLWIGPEYLETWPLVLALMAAAALPLIQSTCITLLDAKLMRLGRSLVLLVMAVLNAAASLILVKPLGYWGPAIGTILSLLLGEGLLMNLHYKKIFALELGRLFRQIFSGILPAALVSVVVSLPLAFFPADTFLELVRKGLVYLAVYLIAMWWLVPNRKKGAGHETRS